MELGRSVVQEHFPVEERQCAVHALWGRTVFPAPVFLSRVVTGNPRLHQRLDRQAAMRVLKEVHVPAA
jgi:hypothetical protein